MKRSSNLSKFNYLSYKSYETILSANKSAMAFFKTSKETLMHSTSYDFIVFRFYQWDDILEELDAWETYITIDEETYHTLYSNLCLESF
ncbi:hypothetical protein [Thalassobellus citreus]|uniref:hypothetical protein n=1 Tax=Thalassobellus citreus TaxID=3367752 RepID=UPI003796AAD5